MQARRFSFAARQFTKQNLKVALHWLAVVRRERDFVSSKHNRRLYVALRAKSIKLNSLLQVA